jgi:Domain of unknown function (DUF4347)/FG-GAP-like repeat
MKSNSILASQHILMTEVSRDRTLVVFDSRVSDIEILSQALLPGAVGFKIDASADGLGTITQMLAQTGAKYLAIVAHGEPGVIHLGKTPLDLQQLRSQSHQLSQWNVAEIAIYSCEVAQGDIGKDSIYQLSELTGATVAASATKTGNPALGGNWDLAITTGEVTAPIVFKSSVLQTYQAVLAVSFSTTNFPLPQAGLGPRDIAVGDFNGDGILDIAIERYASGYLDPVTQQYISGTESISILLGNGAGSFATPRNFGIFTKKVSNSYAFTVGDFNGDKKLDVVTANSSSFGDTVSVLLGDGAGNLGVAKEFATGSAPWKIVAGDFNNDGKLDIATANQYGNQNGGNFSVLLGDGIGGFSAPTTVSTPGSDGIYTVAFGDFNKDGKLDAVTSKYIPFVGYYLSTFVGNGAGGFSFLTDIPLGSSAPSIAIADFNGDGNLDVAAALSGNGNAVAVLLGDGVGGFGAATNFAVNAASRVKTGDFNGDGIIDLAVTSYSGNNSVSVLLGNGSGSFGAATSFAVGSFPSLAVGDFNNDSKLDFAAANYNDKNVVVGLNTSTQTPASITRKNDFNGDGKADILWRNDYGSVAVWQMDGATVTAGSLTSVPNIDPSWRAAGTGDFNGDGKSDILWRNTNGSIAVWTMDGATVVSSSLTSAPTLDNSWKTAGTGDYNGDGKADILWRNDNGSIAVWTMDGATVTSSSLTSTPALDNSWKVAGNSDFTGDGKADILWRNDDGSVALWQMNGAAIAGSTSVAKVSTDWKITGTGDFNGDGKADILWRNDNGSIALWQMDGATLVSANKTSTSSLDSSWNVAGIGDYNGDGKSDILWRNTGGAAVVWTMDGANVVSSALTSVAADGSSWKIAAPII